MRLLVVLLIAVGLVSCATPRSQGRRSASNERPVAVRSLDRYDSLARLKLAAGARKAVGVRIKRERLANYLASKFGIRKLGEGGPIRQPAYFRRLEANAPWQRALRAGAQSERLMDMSADPLFSLESDSIPMKMFLERFAGGQYRFPVVLKPNLSGLGIGVLFFELTGSDRIRVVGASANLERCRELIELFRQAGFDEIEVDAAAGEYRIEMRRDDPRFVPGLMTWWKESSVDSVMGTFDFGMIEEVVPLFTFRNQAYETRHKFVADAGTGEVRLIKAPGDDRITASPGTPGSFYRLGSSSHFSNQTGRGGGSSLGYDLYLPLREALPAVGGAARKFEREVDEKVKAQVRYYLSRLRSEGLELDGEISGQLDLGWSKDSYPEPVLIEAVLHPPGGGELETR